MVRAGTGLAQLNENLYYSFFSVSSKYENRKIRMWYDYFFQLVSHQNHVLH